MSVCVGTGRNIARFNLPVALLSYHSRFFQQEALRHEAVRVRNDSNKKRKLSPEAEISTVQIKVEDSKESNETISPDDSPNYSDEPVVKLPEVDPFIFGLFLKYIYTGYYSAAVDASLDKKSSIPRALHPRLPDMPYTPARASMPPPANINSQQAPEDRAQPYLPTVATTASTMSLQESIKHVRIPPSVHAFLLSVCLGAPGFLNQAINHIYYGIGKHFVLGPCLTHYIWSNTLPHPFCSSSPLRKLVLDVLAVHWSSTSSQIIAKQPVLHKMWNEVLDLHRDLRHEFTMGLQGGRKVLPVTAYFVDTGVSSVLARGKAEEVDSQIANSRSVAEPVASVDTATAKEQENGKDQREECTT